MGAEHFELKIFGHELSLDLFRLQQKATNLRIVLLISKELIQLFREGILPHMNHQGRQQSLEFLFDFFFLSQSQHRLIDNILPESPIDERIVLKDFLVVIIVPD